jgi:hypothetical protein
MAGGWHGFIFALFSPAAGLQCQPGGCGKSRVLGHQAIESKEFIIANEWFPAYGENVVPGRKAIHQKLEPSVWPLYGPTKVVP